MSCEEAGQPTGSVEYSAEISEAAGEYGCYGDGWDDLVVIFAAKCLQCAHTCVGRSLAPRKHCETGGIRRGSGWSSAGWWWRDGGE